MIYYIQAEVRIKGRYKRLYLWQHKLWRESRSQATSFNSQAKAQSILDQIQASSRHIRNLKIVRADETTQPYRRCRRTNRHRWKDYEEK